MGRPSRPSDPLCSLCFPWSNLSVPPGATAAQAQQPADRDRGHGQPAAAPRAGRTDDAAATLVAPARPGPVREVERRHHVARVGVVVVEAGPVDAAVLAPLAVPGKQPAVARSYCHLELAVAVHVAQRGGRDDPTTGELGPARRFLAVLVPRVQEVSGRAFD